MVDTTALAGLGNPYQTKLLAVPSGEYTGRRVALVQTSTNEIKLAWSDVPVDPSLKTTTGQALGTAGEAPVFIVNNYGKGRAILLNLATSAFGGRVTGTGLAGLDSADELDPHRSAHQN